MTVPNHVRDEIFHHRITGKSYREINKITGVSTTTITNLFKQYFQKGTVHYETQNRKSRYDPIIKAICERIRYFLFNSKIKPKELGFKITTDTIQDKLHEEGYIVSWSKTKQLISQERNRLKKSYLDIMYDPGMVCQFDWGQKKVRISGKIIKLYFAVFALPFSNYRFFYVCKKMNGQAFTDAFTTFCNHMGGVFPILLIDNMKIAKRYNKENGEFQLTKLFDDLCRHYGFILDYCTPHAPWQKGSVENAVKALKNNCSFDNEQGFSSFDSLKAAVQQTMETLNNKEHYEKNNKICNLMLNEKALIGKLPKKHYVYYTQVSRKVNKHSMVSIDKNQYSVPEEYKGEAVTIRYCDHTIKILDNHDVTLCKYTRCYGKNQKIYRVWNVLNKLHQNAPGFEQSREMRSMPRWLKRMGV